VLAHYRPPPFPSASSAVSTHDSPWGKRFLRRKDCINSSTQVVPANVDADPPAIALVLAVLSLSTSAQTFQTLHTFAADQSEGAYPHATLTIGPDGQLYGTTTERGCYDAGTTFKISTTGKFKLLGEFEPESTGLPVSFR
jgi:uncharacterized repeat protein (TIGR03803 family)